jgi:uncharacterized protein with HEPN domain
MPNQVLQSAVLHQLMVLGEAASNLTSEFERNHPSIPWRSIGDFRNVLIHQYFGIRWERVWDVLTNRIPDLCRDVEQILRTEFGN